MQPSSAAAANIHVRAPSGYDDQSHTGCHVQALAGQSPISESSQGAGLLTLDSLQDLPLYNLIEPFDAAAPSPLHGDDYPTTSVNSPAAPPPGETTSNTAPEASWLPPNGLLRQQPPPMQRPVSPAAPPCSSTAPAHQPLSVHLPAVTPCNTALDASSNAFVPCHPPSTPPLWHEHQCLLDDPVTATFIASQLSRPRPRTNHLHKRPANHPAAAPPPAGPIAKPSRKIRPKDIIERLQQHVYSITHQVHHLQLRNDQLQRKKHVLATFTQELAHFDGLAAEIQPSSKQRAGADPSAPLEGIAALQAWTPQQLGDAYRHVITVASRWLATHTCGGAPAPAEVAELDEAIQEFLRVTTCSVFGRVDFLGQVMAQQQLLYPGIVPQEEHWSNALAAMELTEGQVEDLLMAREVYLHYSATVTRQQELAAAAMQQRIQRAGAAANGALEYSQDTDQILRVAACYSKIVTLNCIMVLFWFKHTLTPVQAARGLVKAYPLIPGGRILGNTLHALHGWRVPSGQPRFGPQPSPMDTALTVTPFPFVPGGAQ